MECYNPDAVAPYLRPHGGRDVRGFLPNSSPPRHRPRRPRLSANAVDRRKGEGMNGNYMAWTIVAVLAIIALIIYILPHFH